MLVEPFTAFNGAYESLKQHLEAREVLVVISVLVGQLDYLNHRLLLLPDGEVEGDLSIPDRTDELARAALKFLNQGTDGVLTLHAALFSHPIDFLLRLG